MANQELFNGHKYTFKKDGNDLLLLDSTDHSHETITFREGLVVSGSAPLEVKPNDTGQGIRLYAHNENQIVAQLVTSNDDAKFYMNRNGVNAFYVNGAASNLANFIYAKSHTTTDSYNIAKFVNGNNLLGLQIRADGRLYSHGAKLWLYDDGGTNYMKVFKAGNHAYVDAWTDGHVYLRPDKGETRFLAHGTTAVNISYGALRPNNNDARDLGASDKEWRDIYAGNSVIQASDRNLKEHISGSNLGLSFINDLNPVSYRFLGKNRNHYGLIAQEVSESLANNNVHTDDFAGYIKNDIYTRIEYTSGSDDANPDSNIPIVLSESVDYSLNQIQEDGLDVEDFTFVSSSLGLRYNEFISPLIKAVQELSAEVTSLKARVTELENN